MPLTECERSARRLDALRQFAQGLGSGSVGHLMPDADDDGNGPIDELERSHEREPGVPGESLASSVLTCRQTI